MDPTISPWLSPGFLVPTALAVIGFVAWLIRLEAKVNGTDKTVARLGKDLEHHRTNDGIHFSQRLAQEVERRQGDRFTRIEDDLKEIKTLVKGMAGK